jgi:hypothetical protein
MNSPSRPDSEAKDDPEEARSRRTAAICTVHEPDGTPEAHSFQDRAAPE